MKEVLQHREELWESLNNLSLTDKTHAALRKSLKELLDQNDKNMLEVFLLTSDKLTKKEIIHLKNAIARVTRLSRLFLVEELLIKMAVGEQLVHVVADELSSAQEYDAIELEVLRRMAHKALKEYSKNSQVTQVPKYKERKKATEKTVLEILDDLRNMFDCDY